MVNIFCENLIWDEEKVRWDWKKPYYILANQPKNSRLLLLIDRFRNDFTIYRDFELAQINQFLVSNFM